MIAANLLADLEQRGARVSSRDGNMTRLMVEAPRGALTDSLRSAIRRHRAELLDLIIEIEEMRAIFEEQGCTPEAADRAARECLHISSITPDGELYLRDLAEHDPRLQAISEICGGYDILEVRRITDAA